MHFYAGLGRILNKPCFDARQLYYDDIDILSDKLFSPIYSAHLSALMFQL